MHLFPSTKIFVSFGSFEIAWYAVLILTGALCQEKDTWDGTIALYDAVPFKTCARI